MRPKVRSSWARATFRGTLRTWHRSLKWQWINLSSPNELHPRFSLPKELIKSQVSIRLLTQLIKYTSQTCLKSRRKKMLRRPRTCPTSTPTIDTRTNRSWRTTRQFTKRTLACRPWERSQISQPLTSLLNTLITRRWYLPRWDKMGTTTLRSQSPTISLPISIRTISTKASTSISSTMRTPSSFRWRPKVRAQSTLSLVLTSGNQLIRRCQQQLLTSHRHRRDLLWNAMTKREWLVAARSQITPK